MCPYCKSAFIVEKAINNYNITNNITAGTVNIFGGNSADFVIRAGTLEKYNGASTVVVIPSSVTSIGENAFSGCIGLTEITIPNSVIYIGERAFQGCSGLTEITIPSSVTSIGAAAF
ncbi:MAG: leucine-rich repeat domain-containing protein, partial [Clostridiales bacterium]|nr:leucine-rich repeat domain-containing protein [Clostridiales bacterium]